MQAHESEFMMTTINQISRIAIIGGGPTGITCAKFLLAEKCFETVDVFEQRRRVGGVWNLSSSERTRRIPLPQLDPNYGSRRFSHSSHETIDDTILQNSLEFESPMYDYLETNIPKDLMRYSDFPFPAELPLFPSHQEVLRYLEDYAAEVRNIVHLETQVQDVRLSHRSDGGRSKWLVTTKNLGTAEIKHGIYDAVVVASGHYTVPQTPDIAGLAQWNKTYPGVILHSKAYRRPEDYTGKRVLIIGNSASGIDIAAQISKYSQVVYISGRSESIFGQSKVSWREDLDEIVEFLDPKRQERSVKTKTGTIISALDAVIFATGYFYSYPFLSSLETPIVTDGLRTRDIYRHFLHMHYPQLAFPVINMKVIPFGLAENQAAVIARLWSGRLNMPQPDEMMRWEQEEIRVKGNGKHFHVQKFPQDGAQMNDLYQWALSATPVPGLENSGQGKLGMIWDEKQVWIRSKFPAIKSAYSQKGDDKREIKSIEQLGLDFADWRRRATSEDMDMFREAKCPPVDA